MGIQIQCPNGHQLNVKDKYAGKTGYCPQCQAKIKIPVPYTPPTEQEIAASWQSPEPSVDDLIARLDLSDVNDGGPPSDSPGKSVLDDHILSTGLGGSSQSLLGSSVVGRRKMCPRCASRVSYAFTHCPRCATPLVNDPDNPPPAGGSGVRKR
jgi:hypothetical protein